MRMDDENEKRLILLLKNGSESAFESIFEKYASKLYFFTIKILKDEVEAKDVVQDTFMRVWENRAHLNYELNFNVYLITIAKNKIYNLFRNRVVQSKYGKIISEPQERPSSIEHELQLDDLKRILLEGINNLSPQQKKIILLRAKGYNNLEISEKLLVTKKTVENHLNRAYKQLREQLGDWKEVMPLIFAIGLTCVGKA